MSMSTSRRLPAPALGPVARWLAFASLVMSVSACTKSVRNGVYTNTCGCNFTYTASSACDLSTSVQSVALNVKGWPDGGLANAPQCYTRQYFANVGASTLAWPAGAGAVHVDCGAPLGAILGIILGSVFGGLAIIALLAGVVVLCCCCRRRRTPLVADQARGKV